MIRAHAILKGNVQGVFFRANTRDVARRMGGISGYVKNLPDGTVEIVAEGKEQKVKGFLEKARNFDSPINVREMDVDYKDATGEFSGFQIRY